MRIIQENDKKVIIILDEDETLEISSLNGNKEHFVVKCLNSSLHIDELNIKAIKEKSLEEKEIKKMENFLKRKKT